MLGPLYRESYRHMTWHHPRFLLTSHGKDKQSLRISMFLAVLENRAKFKIDLQPSTLNSSKGGTAGALLPLRLLAKSSLHAAILQSSGPAAFNSQLFYRTHSRCLITAKTPGQEQPASCNSTAFWTCSLQL